VSTLSQNRAPFWRVLVMLSLIGVCCSPIHCQESRPKLVVTEITVIPSITDQSTLPSKSDSEGNIYVRFYQSDFGHAPIVKLSRNLESTTYKLSLIPHDAFVEKDEWQNTTLSDFSIASSGDLYVLVSTVVRYYLAEFSSKGDFEGLTEIKTAQIPDSKSVDLAQLVALPNQRFFITGVATVKKGRERPLNAIYTSDGSLIKVVDLKGDLEVTKETDPRGAVNDLREPIETGSCEQGDDGNAYVMRAGSPARVFVIDPGGNVLRTVIVDPPIEKSVPDTFKVHQGKLAIQFIKPVNPKEPDEIIYRLVDSTSGLLVQDYIGSLETSRWVGYADDGFVFLGSKENKLTRAKAMLP
jgi:hypothetical protein